ncbi:hypothetical protein EV193_1011082 [Herbihabitans rhizosphaerae]|uniref:Uncharacterized protein n=1 Tax=Herbihabitans rhizosphaerae TaxID=1872711 RepID=A0A4Q7L737_9PSEU|nr:hypothetical protein [Herbihabitans rhizosphaerae]RZS45195.1 hypothetical protein EV193_1011082 [Herbihabitans rhizosphaerae]
MVAWLIVCVAVLALLFVTRYLTGRNRVRELEKDFSIEVSRNSSRTLRTAANAACGVLWRVTFTENGLYTRHIFANNIIYVAVSEHPRSPTGCTAKVWTRCRYASDALLFMRPTAYLDTRRKRDKIVASLRAHAWGGPAHPAAGHAHLG